MRSYIHVHDVIHVHNIYTSYKIATNIVAKVLSDHRTLSSTWSINMKYI